MSRVATDATAFAHRDAQAMIMVGCMALKSEQMACMLASTKQIWQAIGPYSADMYENFLADKGEQGVREAYPPATYARLAALKQRYDPTNLFRLKQNIKPMMEESKQETLLLSRLVRGRTLVLATSHIRL